MTTPVAGLLMGPGEGGGGGAMILLVQLALIFLIFYWLLIRPQRKEQEKHRLMIQSLRKGDEIVTSGGIVATIVHAAEDRLTVKTAENTRLVLERSKVQRRLSDGPEGDRE